MDGEVAEESQLFDSVSRSFHEALGGGSIELPPRKGAIAGGGNLEAAYSAGFPVLNVGSGRLSLRS